MTDLHIAAFSDLDTVTLYAILRLRADVFVVEQECSYQDVDARDLEPGTRHVWLTAGGDPAPVAYLRVLAESDGVARIGRVCVARGARRVGHAATLLAAALREIGEREAVLDAQSYATDLYTRVGFVTDGPEFVEDGIPHVPMRRAARPGQVGFPAMSTTIRTQRLVFEPLTAAAATSIINGDLSAFKVGDGWPHDDTRDGLGGVAHGAHAWLVTLDGVVIGDCGTHGPADSAGDVELGYGLAAPYRGRGLGNEIAAGLSAHLLAQPDVRRVVANEVLADNTPSRRALERAGFTLVRSTADLTWYALSAP